MKLGFTGTRDGMTEEEVARFWGLVTKGAGCWVWQRNPDSVGYGYLWLRFAGRQMRTHRISWLIEHGELPPRGIYILHHCDNRLCVRPDHLFAGTHLDNIADMLEKRRGSTPPFHVGGSHPCAKLTESDVTKIRSSLSRGESQRSLARRFGVSESLLSCIANGKLWRSV